MKVRPHAGVIPSNARNLLFVLFFLATLSPAQTPAESDQGLTLAEFRRLLPSGEQIEEGAARADRAFFELLAAQGREAAARQSLDRLSGWAKAAQARLDAESAPALDVEMLRFAEARAEARVKRLEAARLSSASQANLLLGRDPRSPLVALPDKPSESVPPDVRPQQELLTQSQDLLARIYQNYLFGGVTLTALLWQEDQVYRTELQYRLSVVEAERRTHTARD